MEQHLDIPQMLALPTSPNIRAFVACSITYKVAYARTTGGIIEWYVCVAGVVIFFSINDFCQTASKKMSPVSILVTIY